MPPRTDSAARQPVFESWPCCLRAVWLWEGCLTPLCLSFLSMENGKIRNTLLDGTK